MDGALERKGMDNIEGCYLLRGLLIGLLFGLPVGAVGAMAVQRTFHGGFSAGLITGLGSSFADGLYACAGALGFSFVSGFLLERQRELRLLGGALILSMGLRLLLGRRGSGAASAPPVRGARLFWSSFAVGITNPAAMLTFLFAFSWFGIPGQLKLCQGLPLVGGVLAGTGLWWAALSGAVCAGRKRWGEKIARWIDPVFGSVFILLALAVFAGTWA